MLKQEQEKSGKKEAEAGTVQVGVSVFLFTKFLGSV